MSYLVKLTYFKHTGKYYSEGEYESTLEDLDEIWDQIRIMKMNKLPGLTGGGFSFIISVDVPDHPHNHPRLIL